MDACDAKDRLDTSVDRADRSHDTRTAAITSDGANPVVLGMTPFRCRPGAATNSILVDRPRREASGPATFTFQTDELEDALLFIGERDKRAPLCPAPAPPAIEPRSYPGIRRECRLKNLPSG